MWGLIAGFIIGITRLGAKVYYTSGATFSDSWFKYLFLRYELVVLLWRYVIVLYAGDCGC